MNPTALDFRAIQIEMEKFHKKYQRLPNVLFLPATCLVTTVEGRRVAEIFELEVKFAACNEPIVGLMVKE